MPGSRKLHPLVWLTLIPASASAQVDCSSPELVLQRYVSAIGGKAAYEIRSRTATARESTTSGGVTERYVYKFKWKTPDKVAATSTPYMLNVLPLSYPNGTFIFNGAQWTNNDGRVSRNEERDPEWQRLLKHKYPYNEDPDFLMLRVVADPLMIARAGDLYSSLEAEDNSTKHPGLCVLRANGVDKWRYKRQDILSFDAASGFLRSWQIQVGVPPRTTWVQFDFDDYRQVGAVKFPFMVAFDFYKATFRYVKVIHNGAVNDSDFVEKPAKP
jgi:hypothetical protein